MKGRTSRFHRGLLAGAILCALGLTVPLSAAAGGQPDPAGQANADAEEATTLSAMTVTAQKREEQLQEVPISLTALAGQELQDAGVDDIRKLEIAVPGLTVTSTQSEVQMVARIRGIGTVGDNAGLESSVGVVIDGVYRPRNGVGFGDLGALDRIEVLKGPQGTVFGKNNSAGVINVMTRRPYFDTGFEGEVTFGDYSNSGFAGLANIPLGEIAAASVHAVRRNRDGYMKVETGAGPRTETRDYDRDYHSVRGQLYFEPSADFDLRFILDTTKHEENCCVGVTIAREPTPGAPVNMPALILDTLVGGHAVSPEVDPFARVAWANRPTDQDIRDWGVSAEANWTMTDSGNVTLTSITALRGWQAINALDLDYSSADLVYRNGTKDESLTRFRTLSQELRLTGTSDRFDWMAGVFLLDEQLDRNDSYSLGAHYEPYLSSLIGGQVLGGLAAQLAPMGINVDTSHPELFLSQVAGLPFGVGFTGLGSRDNFEQRSRSVALFTNNTLHATDALDITLGLRYTRDRKRLDAAYSNPNGGLLCGSMLSDPTGKMAAALMARGIPLPYLPPEVQASILGAVTPQVVGYSCLPWANALHNGREVHNRHTEGEWSGTLKAAWQWSDDFMTWLAASRGYKGSGYNLDRVQSATGLSSGTDGIIPVDDTSFAAEFVDSYELGTKTTWAGGNLLLNAALFHQTYKDFQLNSFLGTSFVVRSIPRVVSKGVDADLQWQTGIDGLMLRGGLMYAETRYGNDPLPDAALSLLPGSRASFAPLWSATAGVTWEWAMGGNLLGRFNLTGKYMTDYNTGSDLEPHKMQKGYGIANMRVGIGAPNRSWMLELWAENITDQDYLQVGYDAPVQAGAWNGFLGMPRTWGATLRFNF